MLVYNANRRAISAGDNYPARYLPFAIWKHQTVLLDPIAKLTAQGRGASAYWMVPLRGGHIISLYPVTVPVLISPLYLPAVAYLHFRGWTDWRVDHVARVMEKLVASFLAALSAALLYVLLRRRATASIAMLLTLAYAFGTTTWVISSQALWQHGMAQLLVVGALLFLTAPCTAPRAIAAGLLCGLIASNRPPDVILAAALGLYALFWAGWRRAALFTIAAALPVGLVLLYNLGVAGNVAGGYGLRGKADFFQHDLLSGVGGLLFSPTRGLFVFSPFLVFLILAWKHFPRDRGERGLTMAMGAGVVVQVLLYAKADWRGGLSWGPRYMTDVVPFLMWMLVPVVATVRGLGRICFMLAVSVAIAIQAIGAFCYAGTTDISIFAVAGGPSEMRAAWDWRNAPFVTSLQRGLKPAELLIQMRGSFDAIEVGDRPTQAVVAGEKAVAAGWALAGHQTPRNVAVTIDGRTPISSRTFFDRPDVRDTFREGSPSGWRIPFETASLTPGEHELTAFAWASEKGERYYLGERRLTVERRDAGEARQPDVELSEDFKIAAERLREHQQTEGSWLTTFTRATRFEEPRPEMNVYLTALMIDLLDPVAAKSGLAGTLQRARRHLNSQIESGGLVRYHGLPNGPGIGRLGCAITPDTDDTALVWRLAPAKDRKRLTSALATIDQFRTAEGLYRTWLARREDYQCLDPGSDPNPADLAIQMHLLMWLSDVRPAAGNALCKALRPVVGEDRVWVYYRRTPLVPILRLTDMRRAGCELELPESRMRTDVPGQEIWVSVARMLRRGGAQPDTARMRAILLELARDDFTSLRTNPPLLYHNDLTATVSRYYWSEDVGYALWLRLHHEYEHHRRRRLGG